MPYLVSSTHNNSYRCPCCSSLSTSVVPYDTIEDALLHIPTEFPSESEFGGIIRVVVTDTNGLEVARSEIEWLNPIVFGRGSGYKYTRWLVWDVNGDSTEQIIVGRNIKHGLMDVSDALEPDAEIVFVQKTWDAIKSEAPPNVLPT